MLYFKTSLWFLILICRGCFCCKMHRIFYENFILIIMLYIYFLLYIVSWPIICVHFEKKNDRTKIHFMYKLMEFLATDIV